MMSLSMTGQFVGRTDELDRLGDLIDGKLDIRKVGVSGPGGIGKTKVLEHIEVLATEQTDVKRSITVSKIVDFYDTNTHSYYGLLDRLVLALDESEEHFQHYHEERNQITGQVLVVQPQEARDTLLMAVNAFVDDFVDLCQREKRVIVRFDTLEEVGPDEDIRQWLFEEFIPRLADATNNSLFMFAGRPEGFGGEFDGDSAELLELAAFDKTEAYEYLERHLASQALADFNENDFERIWQITGRRPILLALVTDWIPEQELGKDFREKVLEPLEMPSTEAFEPFLVGSFMEGLEDLQKRIILAMAVLYRRFNREILTRVSELSESEAEKQLEGLAHLSFVKYRPSSHDFAGSCLLHDEMRDLVRKAMETREQLLQQLSRDGLQAAISYYGEKIEDQTQPAQDELIAEKLFYELSLGRINNDLDYPVEEFIRIAEEGALLHFDLDLATLLIREIERPEFYGVLSKEQQDRVDLVRARVAFTHEETTAEARTIIEDIVARYGGEDQITDPKLKAEINFELGRFDIFENHYQASRQRLERSSEYYTTHAAEDATAMLRSGIIQNYLGWAHRRQGHLAEAIEYYDKAENIFRRIIRDEDSEEANLWLGFVHGNRSAVQRLSGDPNGAVRHAKHALKLYQRLGNEREQARNLNNLGMAYRDIPRYGEAEDAFQEALDLLQVSAVRDRILLGRTYQNMAFLHYRGREWVKPVESRRRNEFFEWQKKSSPSDDPLMKQGLNELQKAKEALREVGATSELVSVYNKFGGYYLLVGKPDNAEDFTLLSLDLAEQANDYYHMVDCCADMAALLYFYELGGDIEEWIEKARSLQEDNDLYYPYLSGRMETTLGNVALDSGDTLGAIKHYAKACQYMYNFNQASYQSLLNMLDERLLDLTPKDRQQSLIYLKQWHESLEGSLPDMVALYKEVEY